MADSDFSFVESIQILNVSYRDGRIHSFGHKRSDATGRFMAMNKFGYSVMSSQ